MVFVESPIFTADVMELLSDEEYADLQQHLAQQPDAGALITQTGGLRKGGSTQDERGVVTMDKKLFERLVESMQQHEEIRRGEQVSSREFFVNAEKVKEIRSMTGLSQSKFARLLDVDVGTLRNWEQGRRQPTGPARALLRAIKRDPKSVLKALAA